MSEIDGEQTSVPLDEYFDLPPERSGVPSSSAFQCPVCSGIAYNPVCPYCAEDEERKDGVGA